MLQDITDIHRCVRQQSNPAVLTHHLPIKIKQEQDDFKVLVSDQ